MNVLIDTCIIIDVLQKREPFVDDSKDIFFYYVLNSCLMVL